MRVDQSDELKSMNVPTGTEMKIESYLAQVRVALRGLPEPEVDDILQELRSHVADESGGDGRRIAEALDSLGDPVELAWKYRADNQMVHAECSGSPLVILQGLRHATRSRMGRVSATALYFFGYFNLFLLWSAAVEKLLSPSRVGLWYVPGDWGSTSLVTFDNPPRGARELLGWWLVPIAALVGWGVKVVTDRTAQWWIGRYRRNKESREL